MAAKTAAMIAEPAAKTSRAKPKKRGTDTRQVTWACTLFSHLAVPLRYRIVMSLAQGEQSVVDLSRAIGQPPSPLSPALRLLRQSDVVISQADGPRRIYKLTELGMRLAGIGLSLAPATGQDKIAVPAAKPRNEAGRQSRATAKTNS